MPLIKAHIVVSTNRAPPDLQTCAVHSLCNCVAWVASKGDTEHRIEDNDGVDSRLGRCQDVTRRMLWSSTVSGNFSREVSGQFLVN